MKTRYHSIISDRLMRPTPLTFTLHKTQSQLSGIQFLIDLLKISRVAEDFNSLGNIVFHTIDPKFRRVRSPELTVLTWGLTSLSPDLVSLILADTKMSFMKGGERSCLAL